MLQAHLPLLSTGHPTAFASASLVVALEQQVEQRFRHLEQQLNGQFGKLLASICASQAPAAATPPTLNLPHPMGRDLAGPQPLAPAGELQPLSVLCSFAWVPVDIVALVEHDQLKPEHLVNLHNPELRFSWESSRSTGLTLTDGQLSVVEDSANRRTFTFVKAIPSIAALAQVWLIYVAICARHMANLELNAALLAHLEQLIEFDHLYSWHAMAGYHLAVCRQCFGTAAVSEWASYNSQVAGRVLFPFQKSLHTSSRLDPNPGSSSTQPTRPSHPRQRPIPGAANKLHSRPKRAFPAVLDTLNVDKRACTAFKCATASAASKSAHKVRGTCNVSSQVRHTFNVQSWANTAFKRASSCCPPGGHYQTYADQLRGALRHGARLRYEGPLHSATRLKVPNLPLDDQDVFHLHREIGSIGIHASFVTIHYKNLDTMVNLIHEHLGASLWKADLEDAFRHVIVAESDARLMGIHFDSVHYQECALAFGAHSSPFLFNLFAEFLHWLMAFALQSVSTNLPPAHLAAALGFKISDKKTLWDMTKLEILGIELDSVAQTASITAQHRQCILQLCACIAERGRTLLLELQQVAGHLQFVTQVEHVWTDASKRSIGAHLGSMANPSAAFSHELSCCHRQKDICFLEALAVLEALHQFSPFWTTTLPASVLTAAVQHHPAPSAFVAASGLSCHAASLLWSGLAHTTRARSATVLKHFGTFTASLGIANSLPASPTTLIEWVAHHHTLGKSFNTVKHDLYVLKSWHINLGLPIEAFDSPRLERVVRGFKCIVGNPLPVAKLPITLPLLRQLLRTLPTVCPSQHNRCMFCAAFYLAFACFLHADELTWDALGPNTLTVSSVTFAADRSYATVTLPASKTDPFWQGATLLAPAVPLSTCAVACLQLICRHCAPQEPLFMLEGNRPFDRGSFVTMLRLCLEGCGVAPSSYSGHSFSRGAATWAARQWSGC
ncbi:hypothetical protein NDA13_004056 [Ustilago tritici]|nr:hypothetical protein NDA13_004056 [Ustilago tritici]